MPKNGPIKTQIRIPPELHARLTDAVATSGRSMNSEMVYRLEQSFHEWTGDEQLRRDLESEASKNGRSLQAEIATRLTTSIEISKLPPRAKDGAIEVMKVIDALDRQRVEIDKIKTLLYLDIGPPERPISTTVIGRNIPRRKYPPSKPRTKRG